jgi:hypothetical protein
VVTCVGISTWNVEPLPKADSTQMQPPCISTICLAMASPRPGATLGFGVGADDLVELLENPRLMRLGDAGSGISHTDVEVAIHRVRRHPHFAHVGKLDSILTPSGPDARLTEVLHGLQHFQTGRNCTWHPWSGVERHRLIETRST